MKWHFEKFQGDMAVYIICPNCGFYHNVAYITSNAEICINPIQIYNYCPNCGEKDTSDRNTENVDVIWNKRKIEELWKEINK